MWSEAYPWSGGAAATFVFWGAMRGATALYKGIKYIAFGKVQTGMKVAQTFSKLGRSLRGNKVKFGGKVLDPDQLQKIILDNPEELAKFLQENKNAVYLITAISRADAENTVDALQKAGFLAVDDITGEVKIIDIAGEGKLLISDTATDITIPVREFDPATQSWTTIEKPLYVKKDAAGIITDVATESKPGFTKETVIPSEVFKEYVDDIAKSNPEQARLLNDLYILSDDAKGLSISTIKRIGIKNTNLYKKIYSPTMGRVRRFLDRIKNIGYNTEKTVMQPESLNAWRFTILSAADDPRFYDKVVKPSLSLKTKLADKIKIKFGLRTVDDIRMTHVAQYADDALKNKGGIAFLSRESTYNIDRIVIDEIKSNPAASTTDILGKIRDLPDFDKYFASMSDEQFRTIIQKNQAFIPEYFDSTGKLLDTTGFETKANLNYLDRVMDGLESTDPTTHSTASKELGIVIGFLEQNTDTLPLTFQTQYAKLEIKKLYYLDGRAFITPTSWINKGFAMSAMTEACEGNSMCVYSHAVQIEQPFYMNETANRYFIRTWRPVDTYKQAVGWQAALMHVPEHPRFYVVSPCFAIAKIWKTKYNGEDTIFIKPEKCDVEASNYCYADEDLVNNYVLIWAASDTATVIEAYLTFGASSVASKIVKHTDPVTVAQVIAESAISWPGWPFEGLTYDKMQAGASQCATDHLQEELASNR